jgi:hypothetical protein
VADTQLPKRLVIIGDEHEDHPVDQAIQQNHGARLPSDDYFRNGDREMLASARGYEIALGFLFATLFWTGVLLWSSPQHSEPPQQSQTEHATEPKNQKDITDERLANYTLLLAWFTGILAASTIGLWVVTWRASIKQSEDMKASILASTAAVEVANRAHIAEHRTWLKVYPTEIGPLTIENGKFRITVGIEAQNVGNNPAVAVSLGCEPYRAKGFGANRIESAKLVERTKQFAAAGYPSANLLPGETTKVNFTADAETSPRLNALQQQQLDAGVPEQNISVTITAAYCVIYKQSASDDWSYSSHVLWIKRADEAGLGTITETLPVGSLRGTVIVGESRFA